MKKAWRFKSFGYVGANDKNVLWSADDDALKSFNGGHDYDGNGHTISEITIPAFAIEEHEESGMRTPLNTISHNQNAKQSLTTDDCDDSEDLSTGDCVLLQEASIYSYNDESTFTWRSILTQDEDEEYPEPSTEEEQIQDAEKGKIKSSAEEKHDVETVLNSEFGGSLKTDDTIKIKKMSPRDQQSKIKELRKRAVRETRLYVAFIILMTILIIYFSVKLHKLNSQLSSDEVLTSSEVSDISVTEKKEYIGI